MKKKAMDIRKGPSAKTISINQKVYNEIDWNKVMQETSLAKKGLIASASDLVITKEGSRFPVWNLKAYDFLQKSEIPYTVNPKLWVQANLNLNAGLYKVTENIYQIRGFDVANMTFVKGGTGWIIIDCLSTKETAEEALKFFVQYMGEITISGVLITHSHLDHYGGIGAVIEKFSNHNTKIFAPKNFCSDVIMENVTAGVAMARRGAFQYGMPLLKDEKGEIDVGIGKGMSAGTSTFTDNVEEIELRRSIRYIDGVSFDLLLVLDTEAPSNMFIYIEDDKSLCIAEDANATLHNLYTLRGAKVRNAIAWADALQNAINNWGDKLETVFGVHTWPRFGRQVSVDYIEKQRDAYQYINDQTLRLINNGHTLDEVGRLIEVPTSISGEWYNSQFYGTFNHNAKAVYQRYMGWYNSNAVDLNKLLPQESAKKYVEYMGGEDSVLEKARISFKKEEFQWVAEVTKQVIYANPSNLEAKLLCADALEQLGYVSESGIWRNEYLVAAQELRYGLTNLDETIISEDVLNSLPLENEFYLLSIRLDGINAGWLDYKINFIISDTAEVASTEIKRGIFRYLSNVLSLDASVSVEMSRDVLNRFTTTNEKPKPSEVKITGELDKWCEFLSLIEDINPKFNVITPVKK